MDITLERLLSLIPKKPDGKYVHGAKKAFCETIGAPPNIINEWERGVSRSFNNYLYQIAAKYNVSVEWLKGETDEKNPPPTKAEEEQIRLLLDKMDKAQLLEIISAAAERLKGK